MQSPPVGGSRGGERDFSLQLSKQIYEHAPRLWKALNLHLLKGAIYDSAQTPPRLKQPSVAAMAEVEARQAPFEHLHFVNGAESFSVSFKYAGIQNDGTATVTGIVSSRIDGTAANAVVQEFDNFS